MDPRLKQLLDDLHRDGREHDAGLADRLARWRNLEPESAALLSLLVRAIQPRRMLELGTSNGYSTLWLADAARDAGSAFVSVEIDTERTAQALTNLGRAELEREVELQTEDAGRFLARSEDAAWDLIFLDAERPSYPGYWPDLVRVLAPSGLLVVDNAVSHADEMAPLRELVRAEPSLSESLVPIGAGLLFAVKAGRRS